MSKIKKLLIKIYEDERTFYFVIAFGILVAVLDEWYLWEHSY